MRPLLRPGTSAVRRSPRTLQIGTVAGASRTIADLPGVSTVLRGADGTKDLAALAAGTREPVTVLATAAAALHAAGAVVDASTWQRWTGATALSEEARALTVEGHSSDEVVARLTAREATAVELVSDRGSQRFTGRLAMMLSEAGVPLSGASSLDVPEHARTDDPAAPSLVVVVSTGPGPRNGFDALTGAGIPHLPVVCEADRVRLGPLVRPGTTPCVRCDDLDRTSWEPVWPLLLDQHPAPIASSSQTHPHALGVIEGYAAAVHVASQILAYCDGLPIPVEGAVTVLDAARNTSPTYTPVALHSDCICQILTVDGALDRDTDSGERVARGARMTA